MLAWPTSPFSLLPRRFSSDLQDLRFRCAPSSAFESLNTGTPFPFLCPCPSNYAAGDLDLSRLNLVKTLGLWRGLMRRLGLPLATWSQTHNTWIHAPYGLLPCLAKVKRAL
ncbi:hypothetical protein Tco_0789539 [Tanacetum coccineum]